MALADEYHSLDEVAEAVGHGADWVKRRVRDFEHMKVGRVIRFSTEQAEAFIRTFVVQPGSDTEDNETDPLRDQSSKSRNRRK